MRDNAFRVAMAFMVGVAVTAAVSALWPAGDKINNVPRSTTVETSETITEDDPRWDCATMGNKVCGPVDYGRAINRCTAVYDFLLLQCEKATDGAHIPATLCLKLAGFCAPIEDNGSE